MITIKRSPTADTRTCDFSKVDKLTLLSGSRQHIEDVRAALMFFSEMLEDAATIHDHDKISDIEGFHADFVTGFEEHSWWDRHRKLNRHHLMNDDGVPDDVNLVDVLDMISDCVMAGMARSGSVYELKLDPQILHRAFVNTVELLKSNVQVAD